MTDLVPICKDCAKDMETKTPGLLLPEFICGHCNQTKPYQEWAGLAGRPPKDMKDSQ